jgi:type IV pilus assembly protein PilQ
MVSDFSDGDEDSESSQDPWADSDPWALGNEADEAMTAEAAGPPAEMLLAVDVEETENATLVHLRADGSLPNRESFALADPNRIVIDLPGLTSGVSMSKIEVGTQHVTRVRIGQHADKVRIVLDATDSESELGHWLVPNGEGLVVTIGGPDAAPAAMASGEPEGVEVAMDESADPMASDALMLSEAAPAVEPAGNEGDGWLAEMQAEARDEDAGPVRVYGVQFDAAAERDRIVVASARAVDYRLYEPDSSTLVVSISNAIIDENAAAQLAPAEGGPVSLVHAFQQPETDVPEVRVVVKRIAGLEPRITQDGGMLLLDFDNVGAGVRPPVLTQRETAASAAIAASDPLPAAITPDAPVAMLPDPSMPAQAASLESGGSSGILIEGGLYEGKQYVGRRISLDFKDADIGNLLRLIAEVSDLNIIAGEDVDGKVTIRLVDIPWDQALDLVLLTKGLGFVRVGNVLRIAPIALIKREEEARLHERRAKEKLEDLVVKLQPVNYARVGDISKLVQRLLTPRGTVNTDKRTNTVIIKDIPSVIDEATALIKAIDTQTPQVMIEAKIVEANLDFSRELGTELGFGTQPDSDEDDFTIDGLKPTTVGDTKFPFNEANNVVFTNPLTSAATGVLNLGAFIVDDKVNVDFRLAAAESNGEGKVISSPRVVTLDNRQAVIQQGVAIPFQTFENGDAKLEFIDAVLMLKVTPHITADRSIIMKISVSRDAPDDSVATPTGSPAIAKNQAKTEALVKDGQTLVLGGIYVVNKTKRESRTPYLYKLPLLGWMFKNNLIRDLRKELLIFVTPRIVTTPKADAA